MGGSLSLTVSLDLPLSFVVVLVVSLRKGNRKRPLPNTHAVVENMVLETKFYFPITNALCFSHPRYESLPSLVARLFVASCPSAIPRFVVAVRVNSVDAGSLWSRPHVGKKVVKT